MRLAGLKKKIEQLVAEASFSLRPDVLKLVRRAYAKEKNRRAKSALGFILDNAHVARTEKLAICQDTGLPIVFIEVGKGVAITDSLVTAIRDAVASGYRKNFLRPSIVAPLDRSQSSYRGIEYHIDFVPRQGNVHITIFPKGFGSENKSQLKMFNPTVSKEEILEFIANAVKEAGPNACPPYIVGVGIGATSNGALLLAKKALLERIDKPNKNIQLRNWERQLLVKINSLGIGAMGFGGGYTALSVKIKTAPTHIAGFPVAVNISCHALRSATLTIRP